jgi:ribosome-binding protein aMBF1 (putative translation factor)
MEHQDWTPVVVKKKNNKDNKDNNPGNHEKSKVTKLEEQIEEGTMKHKKMDITFGKTLQKYRLSQGYTQKDLATKLNIPVKDINEIESGKAKHNGQLMGKIKRIMK